MFEKNQIFEKESLEYPEEKGRYNIYYDRNKTIKCPQPLSKEEIEYAKQGMLDVRKGKELDELSLEDFEFKKEIEKRKKWISDFGANMGITNLKDRLDNITTYFLSEEIYKKVRPNSSEKEKGMSAYNEMIIRKQSEPKLNYHTLQHELLHLGCKNNIYLARNEKSYNFDSVSSGFGSSEKGKKFDTFNEGITEITNQQIYFKNNDIAPTTYHVSPVIFATELVKDISQKTGEKMTEEKILEHFQKGMFEGKKKYLKIIKDIYGEEALRELAGMQNETNDIIRVSKVFNLSVAIDKINKFNKLENLDIDICNDKITLLFKS